MRKQVMQLSKAAEEEMARLRRLLTVAEGERDALRAQVAALVAAGEMCIVELKDWMKSNGEDLDTLHAIQTAEAAIAAAERSAG